MLSATKLNLFNNMIDKPGAVASFIRWFLARQPELKLYFTS